MYDTAVSGNWLILLVYLSLPFKQYTRFGSPSLLLEVRGRSMWMGVCQLWWRLSFAVMGSSSVLREVCGFSLSPLCLQKQTSHCRHPLHFVRLTSCEPAGHSNKRSKLESRSFLSWLHVLSGASGAQESLSVHFYAGQNCMSQTPINGALAGLLSASD